MIRFSSLVVVLMYYIYYSDVMANTQRTQAQSQYVHMYVCMKL